MLLEFKGKKPRIENEVYLGPGCQIIGDVTIKKGASIWPNAVIRGDIAYIFIGEKSNIQDNSTLHVDEGISLTIGSNVTVGHGAILHACTIEDNCLIGMGATVLTGAKIGEGSIIGAGCVVTEDSEIPPYSLVLGVPGKIVKKLDSEQAENNRKHAESYTKLAGQFLAENR